MDIKSLILKIANERGEVRVAEITRATGFSRAYVHRFVQELRRDGKIVLIGKANSARYVKAKSGGNNSVNKVLEVHRILKNVNLSEDLVLEEIRRTAGIFARTKKNVQKIVEYAFLEMLNNAIDHSRSGTIDVKMQRADDGITFRIRDWGIGIFKNIKETRHLANEMEAIQELLKGKETTAPDKHSGEGIFFTSKAVDRLILKGSKKQIVFDNEIQDVFVRDAPSFVGTSVECLVSRKNTRNLTKLFQNFTNEEFQFDRTTVRVHLFKVAGSFVSRSQARRLLVNLERFRVIEIDFKDVESIGQGFADEVFRVWARQHPNARIQIRNAGDNVRLMVHHVGWKAA